MLIPRGHKLSFEDHIDRLYPPSHRTQQLDAAGWLKHGAIRHRDFAAQDRLWHSGILWSDNEDENLQLRENIYFAAAAVIITSTGFHTAVHTRQMATKDPAQAGHNNEEYDQRVVSALNSLSTAAYGLQKLIASGVFILPIYSNNLEE